MSGHEHAEDGYDGPAELIAAGDDGAAPVPVTVTLRGQFDPISGKYHWYGRVAADPAVARLVATSGRGVVLRTPHGEVTTKLADVDPWGRPRVEGFGPTPFPVLDTVADD